MHDTDSKRASEKGAKSTSKLKATDASADMTKIVFARIVSNSEAVGEVYQSSDEQY